MTVVSLLFESKVISAINFSLNNFCGGILVVVVRAVVVRVVLVVLRGG